MKNWFKLSEKLPVNKSLVLLARDTTNEPIPSSDKTTCDLSYYFDNEHLKGFGRVQDGEGLFDESNIIAWRYIDADEMGLLISEYFADLSYKELFD